MFKRILAAVLVALASAPVLQAQTLTIPEDLEPATFANNALTIAAPTVTILVTIGFTVVAVSVIWAVARRLVKRFGRV